MSRKAIEIRKGGFASVFDHGRLFKRSAGDGPEPEWIEQIADEKRMVRESRVIRLEEIYRNPELQKPLRRFPFPRLQETKQPEHIDDFFDVPLIASLPSQKIAWLVESLIPEGELILITGLPSSFKSFFAEYLAAAVSRGRPFLGRNTKRTRVLLLDRDNPAHIIAERRELLNLREGGHLRVWGNWVNDPPPAIGDPRLEQMARDYRLLIIFDSLVRFHSAEENSAHEMAEVMRNLRKLVTAGATVVVLHHSSKPTPNSKRNQKQKPSYRGSSDIHAAVDMALSLSVDRATDPPTLTLECFKHRAMEEFTLTLRPDFEHGQFEIINDAPSKESAVRVERLKAMIEANPGLNQQDLVKRSKIGEHTLSKILNAGEGKHWRVERGERKTKRYYSPEQSE